MYVPGSKAVCLLDAADVFLLFHTSCQQRKCVFCVSQFKRRTFALLKEGKTAAHCPVVAAAHSAAHSGCTQRCRDPQSAVKSGTHELLSHSLRSAHEYEGSLRLRLFWSTYR